MQQMKLVSSMMKNHNHVLEAAAKVTVRHITVVCHRLVMEKEKEAEAKMVMVMEKEKEAGRMEKAKVVMAVVDMKI